MEHLKKYISFLRVAFVMAVLCLASGCAFARTRLVAAYDVKDTGEKVTTKNKYYLVGIVWGDIEKKHRNVSAYFSSWLAGNIIPECEVVQISSGYALIFFANKHNELEEQQPGVFAQDGIPIIVRLKTPRTESGSDIYGNTAGILMGFSRFLSVFSCGLLCPYFVSFETHLSLEVFCLDDTNLRDKFEGVNKYDVACGNTPWWALCFTSPGTVKGYEDKRIFRLNKCHVNFEDFGEQQFHNNAQAYAIASKLKEMEDKGFIDDQMVLRAQQAWATRNASLASKSNPQDAKPQVQPSENYQQSVPNPVDKQASPSPAQP